MTEDEARQKWCPYTRYSNMDRLEMGDMGWDKEKSIIHPAYRCMASNCMMWRWGVSDDCSGFRKPDGTNVHPTTQGAFKEAKDAGW